MALEAYASVADYAAFWCMGEVSDLNAITVSTIEHMLMLSSAQLHIARASVGVSTGELSQEARLFFRYLNCIIAAVINNCPCGTAKIPDEQKNTWLYEISQGLTQIKTGEYPLVAGESGTLFPYADYAQINYNHFSSIEFWARSLLGTG